MFKYIIIVIIIVYLYFKMNTPKSYKKGTNLQLTKNFNLNELDCNSGKDTPGEVVENLKLLCKEVQKLRDEYGKPFIVNSGYRDEEYNKKIGGVKNSNHIKGKAMDIHAPVGSSLRQFLLSKEKAWNGGFGVYNWGIHLDIRSKSRWNG